MNIIKLQRLLRAGATPEKLGAKQVGKGCQKAAYLLDEWIIKANTGGYRTCPEKILPFCLVRMGLHRVKQFQAGEKWIIQEACITWDNATPTEEQRRTLQYAMQANDRSKNADIHRGNVGIDKRGNVVCFDW